MASIITIDGRREGYAPDQIRSTMTVGELIDYLSQFDENSKVMLSNDNGYTYGSITYTSFEEIEAEDEEEEEDEEDE